MNDKFSEGLKEPSTNIKMHKKSGPKPEHTLIFANVN